MSKQKLRRKVSRLLKIAENKRNRLVVFISLGIVMSFILMYAGHFLYLRLQGTPQGAEYAGPFGTTAAQASTADAINIAEAVGYIHKTEEINGLKQEINLLEVDPGAAGIRIQPVLSHDVIYGFELLSEMAAGKRAYAAVTGGFFSKYGLPSGMVVIDGELISAATGKYPVFIIEDGKAAIKEFKSSITVEFTRKKAALVQGNTRTAENTADGMAGCAVSMKGSAASTASTAGTASGSRQTGTNAAASGNTYTDAAGGAASFAVNCLNSPAGSKSVAVYTPYYGQTNRASGPNITFTIENGIVVKVDYYNGEVEIPQNGMLISFFDTSKYSIKNTPVKVGDSVKISHLPEFGEKADAYECGCWLVHSGKAVVALKDAWIGVLTNRDPRTAIGIKEDGTVLLLTVDGRQPGYSAGFTGQELAEYLIALGVTDAAMLDGGASAEMLVGGKLVSRPSYKGEERTLAGGILVLAGE